MGRGYRGGYLPHRRRRSRRGCATAPSRRRFDERARARHRHRRARRRCWPAIPARSRRPGSASAGPGAGEPIGGGDGGVQRAAGPVRRPPPVVFLRRVARARPHQPGQPEILVDHVKCAAFELPFTTRRAVRPGGRAGSARRPVGGGARPSRQARRGRGGDRPLALDERVVPGGRRQPAHRVVGQLRRGRQDGHDARHRRDRLQHRASRCCTRRPSTSSRAGCIRWSSSTSRAARRTSGASTATTTPTRLRTAASPPSTRRRHRASGRERCARTATCTSSRASWASRRSSSTRTRTSGRASSTCPSSQMHTTSYWLTFPRS